MFIEVTAEYRNDDPIANDDNWHRGAFWRYTVAAYSIVEEGDAWYASPDSWCNARDRVLAELSRKGLSGQWARFTTVGRPETAPSIVQVP